MNDVPARPVRPAGVRAMQAIRRLHLYSGLLLLPWAILYGATAFLFNHPSAFADAPTKTFGPDAIVGTPFENRPGAREISERIVTKLNEKLKPTTPYSLAGEAKFLREFAFATAKADGRTINLLLDVKSGGGTVRSQPARERAEPEQAPFVTGRRSEPTGDRGGRGNGTPRSTGEAIKIETSIAELIQASVPTILERTGFPTGFPTGDVTVTSVPDVQFPILAEGRVWTATYNPMTGALAGSDANAKPESELGWRRFLLRLHTAHGYPGEPNARWFWAVIVDVMAFATCFWGISGLVMWWQLKAQRRIGFALLALSTIAATANGVAMHAAMTS